MYLSLSLKFYGHPTYHRPKGFLLAWNAVFSYTKKQRHNIRWIEKGKKQKGENLCHKDILVIKLKLCLPYKLKLPLVDEL